MDLKAEEHITKILNKKIPYVVEVYNTKIYITNHAVYPPGSLSEMFAKFLVEKLGIKNKTIADIGCGCSALGIMLALNGAKKVVGVDINKDCISCSDLNISRYNLSKKVSVVQGDGVTSLLKEYQNEIDVLISGAPWSTISKEIFDHEISQDKKGLYRAFYDIEDGLITGLMTDGFKILKSCKKVYITSSMRALNRIDLLARRYSVIYKIIESKDIHQDGNIHYILCLERDKNAK